MRNRDSGPHRFVLFQIGIAEAAGVDQATVIGDGQGGAGRFVLAHERGHQIVIGGQLRHDGARDLATGTLTVLPQGDPCGGRVRNRRRVTRGNRGSVMANVIGWVPRSLADLVTPLYRRGESVTGKFGRRFDSFVASKHLAVIPNTAARIPNGSGQWGSGPLAGWMQRRPRKKCSMPRPVSRTVRSGPAPDPVYQHDNESGADHGPPRKARARLRRDRSLSLLGRFRRGWRGNGTCCGTPWTFGRQVLPRRRGRLCCAARRDSGLGSRSKHGDARDERRGLEIRIEPVGTLGMDCVRRDEHGASDQQGNRDRFHGSASPGRLNAVEGRQLLPQGTLRGQARLSPWSRNSGKPPSPTGFRVNRPMLGSRTRTRPAAMPARRSCRDADLYDLVRSPSLPKPILGRPRGWGCGSSSLCRCPPGH